MDLSIFYEVQQLQRIGNIELRTVSIASIIISDDELLGLSSLTDMKAHHSASVIYGQATVSVIHS